jgi:hypothetical protein
VQIQVSDEIPYVVVNNSDPANNEATIFCLELSVEGAITTLSIWRLKRYRPFQIVFKGLGFWPVSW